MQSDDSIPSDRVVELIEILQHPHGFHPADVAALGIDIDFVKMILFRVFTAEPVRLRVLPNSAWKLDGKADAWELAELIIASDAEARLA